MCEEIKICIPYFLFQQKFRCVFFAQTNLHENPTSDYKVRGLNPSYT